MPSNLLSRLEGDAFLENPIDMEDVEDMVGPSA